MIKHEVRCCFFYIGGGGSLLKKLESHPGCQCLIHQLFLRCSGANIGFIIANFFNHTTAGFHQLVDIGKKTYGDIKWLSPKK